MSDSREAEVPPEALRVTNVSGESLYVCFTSVLAADSSGSYRHRRVAFHFPSRITKTVGKKPRHFVYRLYAEGSQTVLRQANCRIPASEEAEALVEKRLHFAEASVVASEASDPIPWTDSSGKKDALNASFQVERISAPKYYATNSCGGGGGGGPPSPPPPDPPPPPPPPPDPPPLPATRNQVEVVSDVAVFNNSCHDDGDDEPGWIDPELLSLADDVPFGGFEDWDCEEPCESKYEKSWCEGSVPTGELLTKTQDALDRIEQRGGECAVIAQRGQQLLADGNLKYYPSGLIDAGGWGSSTRGKMGLAEIWTVLDNPRFTVVNDRDGSAVKINLDFGLVHEIEHVMGRSHIILSDTHRSEWINPHSKECSGLY